MGLFSAIAGVFAGNSQKKAVDKAAAAQTAALNRGIDIQNQQYETTRADYMPYTQAGTQAIGGYGNLLGTNGADAQSTAIDGLKGSAFYQQSLDDANENLLQTASATGGVRGGNTAGAVGQLSPALLAAYYQQALSGYGNLAQLGLGATGSVANAGLANANAATGLTTEIGDTAARKYITKGGINAATINNIGGFLDQAASSFMGGFGMPSSALVAGLNPAAQQTIKANPGIF
ncbi:hypothetical protein ACFOKI_06640 [Sphingomonas qilianensis]